MFARALPPCAPWYLVCGTVCGVVARTRVFCRGTPEHRTSPSPGSLETQPLEKLETAVRKAVSTPPNAFPRGGSALGPRRARSVSARRRRRCCHLSCHHRWRRTRRGRRDCRRCHGQNRRPSRRPSRRRRLAGYHPGGPHRPRALGRRRCGMRPQQSLRVAASARVGRGWVLIGDGVRVR